MAASLRVHQVFTATYQGREGAGTNRRTMDRRSFLRAGVGVLGALALGPGFTRRVHAAGSAQPGPSPYGSLAASPDANGLLLPPGFTSRVVARAKQVMPGTGYSWHTDPDGGAVFALPDGGWVYASNQEERIDLTGGGVGVLRFDADGNVVDAYRVLDGTYTNCAGGPTPWGTWLSCEEHPFGQVWECDPTKPGQGVARPAMGRFWHEAVCVDPVRKRLYMTEDAWNGQDGRFYRFTPTSYPDLSAGTLEAAKVGADGTSVTWVPISVTVPVTQANAGGATVFKGAEGVWYHDDVVTFTTKTDNKVWRYDVTTSKLGVLYDPAGMSNPPLTGVDNCVVSPAGELFVAEDGGNMELVVVTPSGTVAPFLRVTGHDDSELSGPAFDPSGTRLYFASMRGATGQPSLDGIVYEVRGPFLRAAAGGGTTPAETTATDTLTSQVAGATTERIELPATGSPSGMTTLGVLAGTAALAAAALGRAAVTDAEAPVDPSA